MVWLKPEKPIDICGHFQISAASSDICGHLQVSGGIFRYLQADLAACEHCFNVSQVPKLTSLNIIRSIPALE